MPITLEPASIKVHKSTGEGVEVLWKDGHQSRFGFEFLRHACPCAHCKDKREKAGRKPGEKPPAPAALLPLYEPKPLPERVEMVGHYALRFVWNDGHQEGLYSWPWLRELCRCDLCLKAQEDSAGLLLDIRNHKPRGWRDHKH